MVLHKDLGLAIASQEVRKLKDLLTLASQVDGTEEFLNGFNYLMDAVDSRNIEIINTLLEFGTNINRKDEDGWTALMYAVLKDYPEIVKYLIRSGADANIESPQGECALYIAAFSGHQEIFAELFSLTSPQMRQEAELKLSQVLQEKQREAAVKPGVRGLISSASVGDILKVKKAIETGINVNSTDEVGETALRAAVAGRHLDLTILLVEAGANVNTIVLGMPILHHAAVFSTPQIVKYLIQSGANLNARDLNGCTALMRLTSSPYPDREAISQILQEVGVIE
jgi:uncharacterized protein